jgi:hypothetical protein
MIVRVQLWMNRNGLHFFNFHGSATHGVHDHLGQRVVAFGAHPLGTIVSRPISITFTQTILSCVPLVVLAIRNRTVLHGGISRNFTDELTSTMPIAIVGAHSIVAGIPRKTIVTIAIGRFTIANAPGRTFRVVVSSIVAIRRIAPSTSKVADTFGAIQGSVTRVTCTNVMPATRTFAGT